MNAERLLAHFERISEAPDAIARLRRFILDLAVRGKLVEQDPEDEPAEDLLGRILELKIRSTGKLPKSNSQMIDRLFDDEPFAIPDSWTWVVLGQITNLITSGSRDWAKHYSNSGAIFVRMGNLAKGDYRLRLDSIQHVSPPAGGEGTRTRLETWDVLVSITGDVGMLGLIPEGFGEAYINQHTALARPCFALKGRYLPEFLRSDFAQSQFQEPQRGIKNSFRLSDLSGIVVPLPPLAEQHRIVAKVDELMALCDQLEAARQERQVCRERLVAATLQRLNQPAEDPASFHQDANFSLQVLPSITTTPAQIKQLRQTILNLAVRGKLVAQDPEDEPAGELVERILSHPWLKKRAKPQPAFADKAKTVMRIPVPDSWTWTTIESLLPPNETVTYGILKPVWVESGVPTVRVTEMKTGAIDVDRLPRCDQSRADKFQKTTLKEGDLLISKDGTIGKTAFVPAALIGGNITQHVLRLPLSSLLSKEYIRLSIDSPWCQTYMSGETKGVALQGVNVGDFRKMPIPLPPLAEQHRIVAKVDELMALCDQLEQQLSQADQQRLRLLEAVLAEALGGRLPIEQEESHAAIA
jgi:type I restriction enzyme S subunit